MFDDARLNEELSKLGYLRGRQIGDSSPKQIRKTPASDLAKEFEADLDKGSDLQEMDQNSNTNTRSHAVSHQLKINDLELLRIDQSIKDASEILR